MCAVADTAATGGWSTPVQLRHFSDPGSRADIPPVEKTFQNETDHFRMYEFKVKRCPKLHAHDWTDCPYAHQGEKARRRDPLRFSYSGAPALFLPHKTPHPFPNDILPWCRRRETTSAPIPCVGVDGRNVLHNLLRPVQATPA
jgi:hypothetical protein